MPETNMIFSWNRDIPESSRAEKLSAVVSLMRRNLYRTRSGLRNKRCRISEHSVNSIDNIRQCGYKSDRLCDGWAKQFAMYPDLVNGGLRQGPGAARWLRCR